MSKRSGASLCMYVEIHYNKLCLLSMLQTDVKGLPHFLLNQVLKRQTLALHHIKRQLISPQHSSSQDLSDDEDNGHLKTERKDSSKVETSFEEGMPTSHFIDHY